ncbi:MAG: hypothetical protein R6V60_22395 [Desulfobacterales bacterium]|jgi:hypothetical protein
MSTEKPGLSEEDAVPEDSNWDRRILCSDGNCIGVIGPDGRCKECGRPYEGEFPKHLSPDSEALASPLPADEPEEESAPKEADSAPADDVAENASADDAAEDSDWDRRVLCGDGNCIGVIGTDGRCNECGKPYDPSAAG